MTPTARSKNKLQDAGWVVAIVEKWNPYARVRQDLFGMFDLLAFKGVMTLGVQTTSGGNVAARVDKIKRSPLYLPWCFPPYRIIVVHGWSKRGARGKRKLWECREVFF